MKLITIPLFFFLIRSIMTVVFSFGIIGLFFSMYIAINKDKE